MNTALIGDLIRLRYRLLWAKTRSRNGRIALFFAGYLILMAAIALLTTGGFGAALAAVRSGKGEMVAQAVLSGIFFEAILASNILGFGLNAIFSDVELRRYPLHAADRRAARHLIGLADPFWLLFFAMDLGLALGLYAAGAGAFWFGFVAALLLFVCNYLLARVVALLIDRMMRRRGGSALLLGLVMLLALGPSIMQPVFRGHPDRWQAVLRWLQITPPFGAASAMIHPGMPALNGILLILLWTVGFLALLTAIENRPPSRTAAVSLKIDWDTWYERAAAFFGPAAPLVAHWLRFYLRNNRTRAMSLFQLPLVAFLTFQIGRQAGANGFFVAALGTFPVATFMGVARITVNQFGYSGGGFRRYFLLPTDPAATLRAGSFASLLLGACSIPILLAAWLVLAPKPLDPAMFVMLACSSATGLLLFNAAALWVSLFNPRKGNYQSSLGNDLSLGGNILVIGGVLTALLAPRLLVRAWPAPFQPENWWMFLPLLALAIAVYLGSLNTVCALFAPRRERLLAVVEGRD
ncbi:MAG TPA: hypothetical protein VMH28_11425 [Candidatus Acidoferrales bacterium]|nr:hypothetical protein [Candidatus Acidoferrales bacterium]